MARTASVGGACGMRRRAAMTEAATANTTVMSHVVCRDVEALHP